VLPLRARQCVFLAGVAIEKTGKVAADGLHARRDEDLGRCADDDPIAVDHARPSSSSLTEPPTR
jgi:hypothetical protein